MFKSYLTIAFSAGKPAIFKQQPDIIIVGESYFNLNQRKAHRPTLYGLMIVGIFLLLPGCINFINMTTAQAGQRAKSLSGKLKEAQILK